MDSTTSEFRSESLRLLNIAEKLLADHDLSGSREFAVLAQETDPLLYGSDQIIAISDVLIAADRTNPLDWYSILDVDKSDGPDLIKKSYRRLALLLHPDRNKFPLAGSAFKLVSDAWAVLSDPIKKRDYDTKLGLKAHNQAQTQAQAQARYNNYNQVRSSSQKQKLPVKRNPGGGGGGEESDRFWTACPYCYVLYEYPAMYRDCSLRCQSCRRTYHGAAVPALPPRVPGKEAYYCCWGLFPLGFKNLVDREKNVDSGFPNWVPVGPEIDPAEVEDGVVEEEEEEEEGEGFRVRKPLWGPAPKKRGRPR